MTERPSFEHLTLHPETKKAAYDLCTTILDPPSLYKYIAGVPGQGWQWQGQKERRFLEELANEVVEDENNFSSIRLLASGAEIRNTYETEWRSWAKPNSSITADFSLHFEYCGRPFFVVGDGSQMLMHRDELPETVRYATTAKLLDGSQLHAPDHLWSVFATAYYFENMTMPVADNFVWSTKSFQEEERLDRWSAMTYIDSLYMSNREINPELLPGLILRDFNTNLGRFYTHLFGENIAREEEAAMLPSGVMAVATLTEEGDFIFAYTGDVDIFEVVPDGTAYKHSHDVVSVHDAAARIVVGPARQDREFMTRVARERVKVVGNLNGFSPINIRTGSFHLSGNDGAIMSTDGARIVHPTSSLRDSRFIKDPIADLAATLSWRDPAMAHLDMMHCQRMYRKAVVEKRVDPNKVPWRRDDSTVLTIRV